MSDGGFDPDEMIMSRRSEENLFGVVVDPITKQYVSYPSVPKSKDIGKTRIDLRNGTGPAKASEFRESWSSGEKQSKPSGQEAHHHPEEGKNKQSEEENIPQNWTLAGKNRENVSYKWVARGETYPVKELLKKAGMRWDPQHREWYGNKKPDIEIEGIYMMKKRA